MAPLVLALIVVLTAAGCGEGAIDDEAFDGARAYRDLQALCDLGPRLPGSEASRQARAYIDYFVPEHKYSIIDDHTPFLERGIAAVDIIDLDYPYWHTAADTADKVSPASLQRVGRVLERLLESSAPSDWREG